MAEPRQTRAPSATDAIAARLDASRSPQLVVAPSEARLVAANAAGARALGMAPRPPGSSRDLALDSAMPAIMQLRRLAGLPDVTIDGVVEPLVFWTPGGAARFLCRVQSYDETAGRSLLLVEPLDAASDTADEPELPADSDPVLDIDAGSGPALHPIVAEEPSAAVTPEPRRRQRAASMTARAGAALTPAAEEPPAPRDPADILRAIARQILAGRAAPGDAAHVAGDDAGGVPRRANASRPKRAARNGAAHEAAPTRDIIDLDANPDPAMPVALSTAPAHGGTDGAGGMGDPGGGGDAGGGGPDDEDGHAMPRAEPSSATAAGAQPEPPSRAADLPVEAPGDAETKHATAEPPTRPQPSARRVLVRRIAHELKSPLSAIASAAEIMKDERFGPIGDERYLRYARDIHESARHALDVIQRMLGTKVEEAAAIDLAFTDLDLNAVIGALISAMEPLAAEAGVKLTASLAPGLPRVVADGTSVRQIALNLLTNALKFTPRGGRIVVSTEADIDGPLTLAVSDSGEGISDGDIAHAADDANERRMTPRRGGGLGIGLPLVRSLATANGATLQISRRDEGGTTAAIVFPKSRQVLV